MTSSSADADRTDLVEELEEALRNAYNLGLDSKRYSPLLAAQPFVEKIDRLTAVHGIDSMLNGLPARAWLNVQGNDQRGYVAMIQMPKDFAKGLPLRYFSGEGDSKNSAVRNAVANITEAE